MTIHATHHHMPTTPSRMMQRHVLNRVAEDLVERYEEAVPAETVRETVRTVAAELQAEARITTYLPALTENEATNRLEALAHGETAAASGLAVAA